MFFALQEDTRSTRKENGKIQLKCFRKIINKKINRSGPKIDPCGTLYSMDCVLELHLL